MEQSLAYRDGRRARHRRAVGRLAHGLAGDRADAGGGLPARGRCSVIACSIPSTPSANCSSPMINIGVALILFEGGLSLDLRELRHAGEAGLAAVRRSASWSAGCWAPSRPTRSPALPGSCDPVRRHSCRHWARPSLSRCCAKRSVKARPAAILKWEGIVNDPIGALCAVIAYEYFRFGRRNPEASLFEVVPPLIFAAIIAGLIGYVARALVAWALPARGDPRISQGAGALHRGDRSSSFSPTRSSTKPASSRSR